MFQINGMNLCRRYKLNGHVVISNLFGRLKEHVFNIPIVLASPLPHISWLYTFTWECIPFTSCGFTSE